MPDQAYDLIICSLQDAWNAVGGGRWVPLSTDFDGTPAIRDRCWWPVTKANGTIASFLKVDARQEVAQWYSRLWSFSDSHSIRASLFPLAQGISRQANGLHG